MTSTHPIDDLEARSPTAILRLARFVRRTFAPYHRAEVSGLERIPEGPGLYVGNHNGMLLSIDTFLWGAEVALELGVEHVPYGWAHEVILGWPVFNEILMPLGAVRAGHDNARALFAQDRKVLVYPGGDIETTRSWFDRDQVLFGQRTGFARLAIEQGVPILPVAAQGAHSTAIVLGNIPGVVERLRIDRLIRVKRWPLMFSIPWGLTPGPSPPYLPLPAKIRVEFLDPIHFPRTGPAAAADADYVAECARAVAWRIQSAVHRLAVR